LDVKLKEDEEEENRMEEEAFFDAMRSKRGSTESSGSLEGVSQIYKDMCVYKWCI
jgi:hypothetical protein